jgi:hypothetical protein
MAAVNGLEKLFIAPLLIAYKTPYYTLNFRFAPALYHLSGHFSLFVNGDLQRASPYCCYRNFSLASATACTAKQDMISPGK